MTDTPKVSAVGLAWYDREDYESLRVTFTDGDRLAPTYDGWLAAALQGEAHLREQGSFVVRALIKPAAFATWCEGQGMAQDAKARGKYASECAYRTVMEQRGDR